MRGLVTYTILFFLIIAGCAPASSDHSAGSEKQPDGRAKDRTEIFLFKPGAKDQGVTADSVFSIDNYGYLHARILVRRDQRKATRPGMYHLVWVDPNGEAFFTKRIDVADSGASFTAESSISLPSDKRQPGKYLLKVYDFREPMAVKQFRLIPPGEINQELATRFSPEISLDDHSKSQPVEKELGNPAFILHEHGWLRADIRLSVPAGWKTGKCDFVISWSGPDGEPFFTKEFTVKPGKSRVVLNSSISIPPGKRDPGNYSLSLLLHDELLAKKPFSLVEE